MGSANYLKEVKLNYWEGCAKTQIDGSSSEKRIPVCLCLDLSGSMWEGDIGRRSIDRLKLGLKQFFNDIKQSENGRSAEVAVVGFVDKGVILQDFELADSFTESKIQSLMGRLLNNYDHKPGQLRCGDLECGVQQSLCLLDARKGLYQSYGIPYFQPMLVIMTDGVPTRNSKHLTTDKLQSMIACVNDRRNARKLSVIAVYCGAGTNEDRRGVSFLQNLIGPKDKVYRIASGKRESFEKFFVFLSMSVSAAGQGKMIDVASFNEKMGAFDFPGDSGNKNSASSSFSTDDFSSQDSQSQRNEEQGVDDSVLDSFLEGYF